MSESEHSYRRRRLENADAVQDGNGSEGFENDVYEKKENFKDFLRSFKIYKYMKNFEKKYLRKNRNK